MTCVAEISIDTLPVAIVGDRLFFRYFDSIDLRTLDEEVLHPRRQSEPIYYTDRDSRTVSGSKAVFLTSGSESEITVVDLHTGRATRRLLIPDVIIRVSSV